MTQGTRVVSLRFCDGRHASKDWPYLIGHPIRYQLFQVSIMSGTAIGNLGTSFVAYDSSDPARLYVSKFSRNVLHDYQVEEDVTAGTTMEEMGEISEKVQIPTLGKSTAQERTGRTQILLPGTDFGSSVAGDTAHSQPDWGEYWVMAKEIWDAQLVHKNDDIATAVDIQSNQVVSMKSAFARKKTSMTLAAAIGNTWTGYEGSITALALPAANVISEADTGLTLAKIKRAAFFLNQKSVPQADRYFFYSAEQLYNVLEYTEVASADYNNVKALIDGNLKYFLGFTWKMVGPDELPSTGTTRHCIAWHKRAMTRVNWRSSVMVRIKELDYLHYDKQIYMSFNFNAGRGSQDGVVRVDCKEILG